MSVKPALDDLSLFGCKAPGAVLALSCMDTCSFIRSEWSLMSLKNESGARYFVIEAKACPACQWLPLWGSWQRQQAMPERV